MYADGLCGPPREWRQAWSRKQTSRLSGKSLAAKTGVIFDMLALLSTLLGLTKECELPSPGEIVRLATGQKQCGYCLYNDRVLSVVSHAVTGC